MSLHGQDGGAARVASLDIGQRNCFDNAFLLSRELIQLKWRIRRQLYCTGCFCHMSEADASVSTAGGFHTVRLKDQLS